MSDARFFGVPANVEVRETHLSYVFLAGDRAFKLKKPLALPFVDYGTAERRREMCEAEVLLNRRLAPTTYVGTRSVAERDGSLALAGPDDPDAVEHLVEMRRFRDEDTLAARLDAGALDERWLEDVGRRLARFHRSAGPGDGRASRLRLEQAVASGLEELAGLGAPVAHLRRFAHAYLQAHRGLLDSRAASVVDGHGDIRAEHVILTEPIEVVDCVEFDEALREIDSGRDLAFLLMDLEARGHPRAAATVLRAYADAGGDPGPPHLIAFYSFERALVRAKVDLIRAAQLPAGPEAARLHGKASRLLELAQRLAWRAREPLLLVLCGLSGSGKTHLAGAIAAASGLTPVNSDVVRKRLAGLRPEERARAEHYGDELSRRTYAELGRLASEGGVLVDATFRRREDRAAFLGALSPDAPEPLFVHCVAPRGVLRGRLSRRAGGVSDATVEVLDEQRFAPLDEVPRNRRLALRTDRPAGQVVDDLEAWLDARMGLA